MTDLITPHGDWQLVPDEAQETAYLLITPHGDWQPLVYCVGWDPRHAAARRRPPPHIRFCAWTQGSGGFLGQAHPPGTQTSAQSLPCHPSFSHRI